MLTLDKRIDSKKKQGRESLFFWYERYCKLAWITISECFLVKKIATKGNRTLNPRFTIAVLCQLSYCGWIKMRVMICGIKSRLKSCKIKKSEYD